MVSNKEINRVITTKLKDTKWIVCEKCKCSYELDNYEHIDDFEDCECGGKFRYVSGEYATDKPLKSNIRMRIDGFTNKTYSICLCQEGVIVGTEKNIMEYIIIPYKDINKIKYYINRNRNCEIKIQTKYDRQIKVKGLNIGPAKTFVKYLEKIVSGKGEFLTSFVNNLEQNIKTDEIPIFSTNLSKPHFIYGELRVRADSSLLSKTATMDDVNARLREEAIKLGANAIINTQYERSSLTSWRGIKARGTAIYIEPNEKKCPFCAEMIKKEAIKCKHCHSNLMK